MWSPLLAPRLTLLSGAPAHLRGFLQELTHAALREGGVVRWRDASHWFNPYDFAEWNLTHGRQAHEGAQRVLVRRCLTPFQWMDALTTHLDGDLERSRTALLVAAPFDRLFATDELKDWEQEDYLPFVLEHLRGVVRRHRLPVVLAADLPAWWRTHPTLARMAHEGVQARWALTAPDGRWRLAGEDGAVLGPLPRRRTTLLDFVAPEATRATQAPQGRRPLVVPPNPPRRAQGR